MPQTRNSQSMNHPPNNVASIYSTLPTWHYSYTHSYPIGISSIYEAASPLAQGQPEQAINTHTYNHIHFLTSLPFCLYEKEEDWSLPYCTVQANCLVQTRSAQCEWNFYWLSLIYILLALENILQNESKFLPWKILLAGRIYPHHLFPAVTCNPPKHSGESTEEVIHKYENTK